MCHGKCWINWLAELKNHKIVKLVGRTCLRSNYFVTHKPGYKTMLQKLLESWYWLGMPQDCKQYAINYLVCRRTKTYNTKKQGLLNLLLIPNRKWIDLSLGFVVELPECHWQGCIFCHILVVVDRLIKCKLYKPLEGLSTSNFIEAIHQRMSLAHGYPLTIVNDQKGQMTNTL